MSDPRALAEKAFALLQEALYASETQGSAETRDRIVELEAELGQQRKDAQEQIAGLESELAQQRTEAREQIASVETELHEEKDCTARLSEVANERRERLSSLEDKLEEAEERYEEAQWHLEKARHFERLVRRRKKLIKALLAEIRAKTKANTALKAGIDGLRTYKGAAEKKQQQLLALLDGLNDKIKEREEALAHERRESANNSELTTSQVRITELETRLRSQAEVMQSLEDELKTARVLQLTEISKDDELDRLEQTLAAKNQVIVDLQKDTDDQQRMLAKLRGSETETVRLKSLADKHERLLDTLERENAQLRTLIEGRPERESGSASKPGEQRAEPASGSRRA